MPVTSTANFINYTTNGIQTDFAFPYPVIAQADILVQTIDLFSSTVVTYTLGTDYSVTTTPDQFGSYPSGLTISFFVGHVPALGLVLLLTRKTAATQLIQLIDNNPFVAGSINNEFDKLTLLVQDMFPQFKGSSLGPPTTGTYAIGDWFKNAHPIAGGYFGWICINAGTPGSWKTFGLITT